MASHGGFPAPDPAQLVESLAPHSMTLRFFAGGIILLYAIGWDLWARRVPNPVWFFPVAAGILLLGYDLLFAAPPTAWLLGIPLVIGGAYVLWRLRLLFGGADAKCIMAFAVLAPFPPALATSAGVYPHFLAITPTAVTMLTNAVLITILIPLFYFLMNLVTGRWHPIAMFLGTRVPLARAQTEPVWVMEWVVPAASTTTPAAGDDEPSLGETEVDPDLEDDALPTVDAAEVEGATLKFSYFPTRRRGYARNLARLKALNITDVWVTPKVPFMVPLFFGFLTAWLVGDLIMIGVLWASGSL